MLVLIVVPRVNGELSKCWWNIFFNSSFFCFLWKVMFFLEQKKAPGRAAPHRRPSWGCTKTPISNWIHWKIDKIRKATLTAGKFAGPLPRACQITSTVSFSRSCCHFFNNFMEIIDIEIEIQPGIRTQIIDRSNNCAIVGIFVELLLLLLFLVNYPNNSLTRGGGFPGAIRLSVWDSPP